MTTVAIATMTSIRNPREEELLRDSIAQLAQLGCRIAVADTGASESFSAFLRSMPNISVAVPSAPGLVAQVQSSMVRAAQWGTPSLLYTEPDKTDFFSRSARHFLASAFAGAESGVVLAARSADSFATYPPMQRYAEGIVNHLCSDVTGEAGDYCYGPFLMNRALVADVEATPRHLGWGWRIRTFLAAHRRGLRIVHQTGDHRCPSDQRTEDHDERAHRLRQLSQNILGLVD